MIDRSNARPLESVETANISDELRSLLTDRARVIASEHEAEMLWGLCPRGSEDDSEEQQELDEEMAENDMCFVVSLVCAETCTERHCLPNDINAALILQRICPITDKKEHAISMDCNFRNRRLQLHWYVKDIVGKATVQDILNLMICGVYEESGGMYI